jgi:hypothetical protein
MKIIEKIKENQWSIPLFGGVLVLISLFTPTAVWYAYIPHNIVYSWMWGFYSIYYYGDFSGEFDSNL